jgi:hypothetical protein
LKRDLSSTLGVNRIPILTYSTNFNDLSDIRDELQNYGDDELTSLLSRFPSRITTDDENEPAEEEWMLKLYITRPNMSFKNVKEGY